MFIIAGFKLMIYNDIYLLLQFGERLLRRPRSCILRKNY